MTSIAFLSNKYRNRKQNAWQQGKLVALFYQAIFITIFMISYYFHQNNPFKSSILHEILSCIWDPAKHLDGTF